MPRVLLHGLRLAAVDIDGVLLNDTFSPVIHRLAEQHQVAYTPELERAVFSRPRLEAARVFLDAAGSVQDPREVIDAYFRERERYLTTHPVHVMPGAPALLHRLRGLGLDVVCYGGLDHRHFRRHLGAWASYFTGPRYICTDAFRPGIEEITRDVFGLDHGQVLFIDDVASVAERARDLGAAFIGRPASFAHGFQRRLMREAGVRYLADCLDDIDETMLHAVARESAAGTLWHTTNTTSTNTNPTNTSPTTPAPGPAAGAAPVTAAGPTSPVTAAVPTSAAAAGAVTAPAAPAVGPALSGRQVLS
ncbi:HAD family phosphatase [Streptomyces flaveolus]|uniref:HAD family phosphatase n=1 Tax=Streptomyces flaveolus TaxID=67297 RepID=UPI00332040CE